MAQGRPLTLNDQVAYLARLLTEEKLFPTPRAADGAKGRRTKEGSEKEANRGHGIDLPMFVQLYPTPTANDSKNNAPPSQRTENGRHSNPLNVLAGGALNPNWVEWLMGFPPGWTEPGGSMNPTSPE
jgi:hypothetical protein